MSDNEKTPRQRAELAMRKAYRPLSVDEQKELEHLKDAGVSFWAMLDTLGGSRELAVAKTKLEECVMWATKHVTG